MLLNCFAHKYLLRNKIVKAMEKDPKSDKHSYGWVLDDFFGKTGMWHNGCIQGFRSYILRFIHDDTCIIVLSNFQFARVEKIGIGIAAIIFGKAKKRVAITVDPKIYDAYVGKYELDPSFIITITKEENRIIAQGTGQKKHEIFPESKTKFFFKKIEAQISFIKDEDGKVIKLILHQGGKDREARRIK